MLETPQRRGYLLAAMVVGLVVVLVTLQQSQEHILLSSPLPVAVMGSDLTGMYAHSAPLLAFVPVEPQAGYLPYRDAPSLTAPAPVSSFLTEQARAPPSLMLQQRRADIRRLMQEGREVLSRIRENMAKSSRLPVSHKATKVQALHAKHRKQAHPPATKEELHHPQPAARLVKGTSKDTGKHHPARGALGHTSHNKEQKYDFNFKGFGVQLSADVRAWQPRPGPWYSYAPRENLQNSAATCHRSILPMTVTALIMLAGFLM
mmetsp:Transcript_31297/g.70456  ORF Transcript_31297/g.70456 Transcript_31297/m.70456 type:complete len:261 (-) Transcript_31297:30-812(-)